VVDAKAVARLLGGETTLGRLVANLSDFAAVIEEGFPSAAMRALVESSAATPKEISDSVKIPERTLMRLKKRDRLPADQSDKLYRIAYIVALATRALGDEDKAHRWLRRPSRALGNRIPLMTIRTEPGLREVERELGRIEYGEIS
jgi:putative toxin-antitoxin system antitoxin component (TIGR02293 family)